MRQDRRDPEIRKPQGIDKLTIQCHILAVSAVCNVCLYVSVVSEIESQLRAECRIVVISGE